MRLEYLQYLVALQRAGSVNKSAQLLHTSAQNVSRVMRQLEEELGCTLFVRTPYGIEMTEAGLAAIQLAEDILGRLAAYKMRFGQVSMEENLTGKLTVAATKIESVRFMNEAVMRFSRLHPQVKLNYVEDDFGACMELVRRVPMSIGVLPILDDPQSQLIPQAYAQELSWRPLDQDQVCIIVARQSKLYQFKSVTYSLLKGGRFVIYAKNDFADGFWSRIIQQYIKTPAEVAVAGTGYILYSKIIDEGYIGLGCRRSSPYSDTLHNAAIRERVGFVPIRRNGLFHNSLVMQRQSAELTLVKTFADFLTENYGDGAGQREK